MNENFINEILHRFWVKNYSLLNEYKRALEADKELLKLVNNPALVGEEKERVKALKKYIETKLNTIEEGMKHGLFKALIETLFKIACDKYVEPQLKE